MIVRINNSCLSSNFILKNRFLSTLTPLQKTIAFVAFAALSVFLAVILIFRCCNTYKNKKILSFPLEQKERIDNSQPLTPSLSQEKELVESAAKCDEVAKAEARAKFEEAAKAEAKAKSDLVAKAEDANKSDEGPKNVLQDPFALIKYGKTLQIEGKLDEAVVKLLPQLIDATMNQLAVNTIALTLEYSKGEIFDTCIVNGNQFALIDGRSLKTMASKNDGNIILNLPDHHIILLDQITTHMVTLKGRSVTIIYPITVDNLTIHVPRGVGNLITYGANINVNNGGDIRAETWYQSGYRISTKRISEYGYVREVKINYQERVQNMFQNGIINQSSFDIAIALIQLGHEILFSKEISLPNILRIWNIPQN